jgi:hypothetical protein
MLRQELQTIWFGTDSGEFRKFGKTIGTFLIFISIVLYIFSLDYAIPLLVGGGCMLLLGYTAPIVLKPVFILWMSLATSLGYIVTRIILGLIFFLIFSPIGLVFRLIQKDHLDEMIQKDAASYWRIRDNKPYEPDMSEKQS